MPWDLTLCAFALQDATAEPALAGPGAHSSLSMAVAAADWGLLPPGLHPDSGLCCLWELSSAPLFPAAPQTKLALGTPRPGECGSKVVLGCQGGRNCEDPGIEPRELAQEYAVA